MPGVLTMEPLLIVYIRSCYVLIRAGFPVLLLLMLSVPVLSLSLCVQVILSSVKVFRKKLFTQSKRTLRSGHLWGESCLLAVSAR